MFGTIAGGRFVPNDAGRMVEDGVASLPGRFTHVRVDTSVVMPDHVHLILLIGEGPPAAIPTDAGAAIPTDAGAATPREWAATRAAPTLGDIVGAFKSVTTVGYIRGVHRCGWPPFTQRLWQRDYHDHGPRDASDLARIRRYILHNPANWRP